MNKEKLLECWRWVKEKLQKGVSRAGEKLRQCFTRENLKKSFTKENIFKILSYVLVVLLSVTVTVSIMLSIFLPQIKPQSKLDILEQLILDRFIGETDQTDMEDAAADAMIGALGDRWSYYIPADEFSAYQEQMKNAYVGVGITITQTEDRSGLAVQQVAAGGPAEEAGILPGDLVVAVDGASIAGMDIGDIKAMIQGKAETTVELTVRRGEESLNITVTRREIKTAVATGKMLSEEVGYVKIVNFNTNCPRASSSPGWITPARKPRICPMPIAWTCPWRCWSTEIPIPRRNSLPLPCVSMTRLWW